LKVTPPVCGLQAVDTISAEPEPGQAVARFFPTRRSICHLQSRSRRYAARRQFGSFAHHLLPEY